MNAIENALGNFKKEWLRIADEEAPDDAEDAKAQLVTGPLLTAIVTGGTGWHLLHDLRTATGRELVFSVLLFATLGLGGLYITSAMTYSAIRYIRRESLSCRVLKAFSIGTVIAVAIVEAFYTFAPPANLRAEFVVHVVAVMLGFVPVRIYFGQLFPSSSPEEETDTEWQYSPEDIES